MADNLIIRHAEIYTPEGDAALKGKAMDSLRHIPEAAIAIRDGRIA